jgi:hypothetical protein
MNASVWLAWVVVALLAVVSISLLMGKSSFMNIVAGYSTMSKDKRQKFNTRKLCRVVGGGLSVITIIAAVSAFYDSKLPSAIAWLIPWGLFGVAAVVLVFAFTVCKAK